MIKDRAPFIVRAGSRTPKKRRGPYNFCTYCGCETVYLDSFHAQYCNHCGAVKEVDSEKLRAQQEAERQQREASYTIADGSAIYSPGVYTPTNIRKGKTVAVGSGGGRTMPIKRNDAITDKLRMKDGRSKEMDAIFKAQDEQLTSRGRTILSDRVELRRSGNITSSDELKGERQGTVDLTGAGKYNPATQRRTRLSF